MTEAHSYNLVDKEFFLVFVLLIPSHISEFDFMNVFVAIFQLSRTISRSYCPLTTNQRYSAFHVDILTV